MAAKRKLAVDRRMKILETAEQLFAKHGYKACTFKMISSKSGVNQGLLHYYFGSKQNLFSEIFLRRAQDLVAQRLALLDAAEAAAGGRPIAVDTLVRGFIEPPLRMLQGSAGERAFVRIHSQLRTDPTAFGLALRRKAFGESTRRYVEAIRRACPHLSAKSISWRFNSMVGTYLVVISHGGRVEDLSGGLCDYSDLESALRNLVAFVVAGFNAPEPAAANDPLDQADREPARRRPAALQVQ